MTTLDIAKNLSYSFISKHSYSRGSTISFWEQDINIQLTSPSISCFNENEVLAALKNALTSEAYLLTENLSLTSPDGNNLNSVIERANLLKSKELILSVTTPNDLCCTLYKILEIDKISIYAKSLFPFIKNSIYRIGVILEKTFPNSFQIPGSHLDFDIFFGNYELSFNGIHRDGANLSFIYTKKSFLFWEYNYFRELANKLALKQGRSPTQTSGYYTFQKICKNPYYQAMLRMQRLSIWKKAIKFIGQVTAGILL